MNVDKSGVLEVARYWKKSDYYDRAEKQDWLDPFWSETSPFRALFKKLEGPCFVELACGHGRHTAHIIEDSSLPRPSRLVLMDINAGNIKHCRQRFDGRTDIELLRNNGMDFLPLRPQSASSIFCFDAMVHFEYDCVIAYIKDAYRVLQKGGRALFHHSNYTEPGSNWVSNPHCRNFMSRELFAHVAMRAGFKVLDQVVLNWGAGDERVEEIDCLTLLEKPLIAEPIFGHASLTHRVRAKIKRWRSAA